MKAKISVDLITPLGITLLINYIMYTEGFIFCSYPRLLRPGWFDKDEVAIGEAQCSSDIVPRVMELAKENTLHLPRFVCVCGSGGEGVD